MAGVLALVGGDEFKPGNEEQDGFLASGRGPGPAYVLATANRKHPDLAAAMARRWFAGLGLELQELPVRSRADALSPELAALARAGGFFYLAGGNPGHIVEVLRDSPVWAGLCSAWKSGAALAGSSAGAMALARWTLVDGRPVEALELLSDCAVLPHYSQYGKGWVAGARTALGAQAWLLGLDERTALVHAGQQWRVMGAGEVHVLQGDQERRYGRGERPLLKIPLRAAAWRE